MILLFENTLIHKSQHPTANRHNVVKYAHIHSLAGEITL